jgi:hypothetical protein
MSGGLLRGIELIDVGRGNGLRRAAGPQICRMHVGVATEEFHFTPAAPTAFMTAVGLTVRQLLAQPLEAAAQSRRVDPSGRAPRTLHADNLLGNAVMLPQLSSWLAN